jgi:hypothetical protein
MRRSGSTFANALLPLRCSRTILGGKRPNVASTQSFPVSAARASACTTFLVPIFRSASEAAAARRINGEARSAINRSIVRQAVVLRSGAAAADRPMRDRIRERLTEYRTEALDSIAIAENRTKAAFAQRGTLSSSMFHLAINEDNRAGFAEYMDRSANFIRHVAAGSWAQYADELRDSGHKLKQEIMAKMNKNELKGQLGPALDKLIKRKVEDFELGFVEGKDMNATTNNTVNIINSQISNAVVQITQSGKDAISKDTALKLKELINSEEIKGLPEETRLDVLDQAEGVIKELSSPVTDDGKVVRGLKRLGKFISDVASKSAADVVAQLATAYAKAHGIVS